MTPESGVIVIGGHFHALGLIRQLARRGIPVILIDHEPCMARFSKYLSGFYRAPRCDDSENFLAFITELADRRKLYGWVVYPSDDEGVYFLATHHDRLKETFRITTSDWKIIQTVYDKRLTYKHAQKTGFPIPETFFPANEDDLMTRDISYPVILKPAIMRHFFTMTHRKVLCAQNPDELRRRYREACGIIPADEIIIQDMIPDCADNLYGFCPFFKEGYVYGRIVAKRPRQHPMDFGQASTFAQTVDLPEIENLGARFLKSIGYYGLCEVEFIFDCRDGKFKLLEVNPRIWGWHTLSEAAGVPLGYLVYRDQIGHPVRIDHYQSGVKWMRLMTDAPTAFHEILKGRMCIPTYLESFQRPGTFAVLSHDDPVPFFAEIAMAPYLLSKRGF